MSVRKRGQGDLGTMNLQEVMNLIGNDVSLEELTVPSNQG